MAAWYCAMDVVSNCAYGEGFGLAAVEAQACGTPVILSDGTTGPQLQGPAKWLVKTQPYWNPVHAGWWHAPNVDSIVAAYEKAWAARGSSSLRDKCVRWAQRYSVEAVAPRWDAAIDRIMAVE
jgi:glycosyltransferase involved in cell wall biosynthesis